MIWSLIKRILTNVFVALNYYDNIKLLGIYRITAVLKSRQSLSLLSQRV